MTGSTAERRLISRLIGGRDPPLLLGGVDLELVLRRRIVAAIAGIGVKPVDRGADQLLDRRDDGCQRMAVIGIARQRLGVGDELAALAVLQRGGDADLDAELVGLVRPCPCRCIPPRARAGCRSWGRAVRAVARSTRRAKLSSNAKLVSRPASPSILRAMSRITRPS